MDRRQFLGTAAGVGAIGWLAHYFLGEPAWAGEDESRAIAAMGDVADAYRRASSVGKPLLVLVIPAADGLKRERGQVFGALLNHGSPEVYLDLALCELVCAPVAEVRRQLKGVKVEGEPLMLLVETQGAAPRATAIDPRIRDDLEQAGTHGGFEKVEQLTKERLATVAAALRAAVAPDKETLAARAAEAEARLQAEETKALREAVRAGKPPEPEALDRGAAIARSIAEDVKTPRPLVLDALARGASTRVTGKPPAGSAWANSSGCGVSIEGSEDARVKCGMGYVPELSRRFLWFFTK